MINDGLVLVDTSVWIDYFREDTKLNDEDLDRLIDQNRVAINPVIRLEILTGAKGEEQFEQLSDYLKGLLEIPFEDDHWAKAEPLRFGLMQDGTVIPIADILIAATALSNEIELFHRDDHFDQISKKYDLNIFNQ